MYIQLVDFTSNGWKPTGQVQGKNMTEILLYDRVAFLQGPSGYKIKCSKGCSEYMLKVKLVQALFVI